MNILKIILSPLINFANDWRAIRREVDRQLPPVDWTRSDWREQTWRRAELRSKIMAERYPNR